MTGVTTNDVGPTINPLCHGVRERAKDGEDSYSSGEEFQSDDRDVVGNSAPILLFQQNRPRRPRTDPVRPVNIGEYQMGVPAWTVASPGL